MAYEEILLVRSLFITSFKVLILAGSIFIVFSIIRYLINKTYRKINSKPTVVKVEQKDEWREYFDKKEQQTKYVTTAKKETYSPSRQSRNSNNDNTSNVILTASVTVAVVSSLEDSCDRSSGFGEG